MLRPDAKRSPHPFDELPAPNRKALAPLRQTFRCSAVQRRLDPLPIRHRQSRRTLHAQGLPKGLCERAAIQITWITRRAGQRHCQSRITNLTIVLGTLGAASPQIPLQSGVRPGYPPSYPLVRIGPPSYDAPIIGLAGSDLCTYRESERFL